MRRTVLAATLLLTLPLPALAENPEAAVLRQDIDRFIGRIVAGSNDKVTFAPVGAVQVTDAPDGKITAIIPSIKVTNKQEGVFTFPATTVTLVPKGDDLRDVTIQFAGAPTLVDQQGKPVLEIVIGAQDMHGLWRRSILNFEKADLGLRDIVFRKLDEKFELTLGRLGFDIVFKEIAAGNWDGVYDIKLDKIHADAAKEGVTVDLGQVQYRTKVTARLADYVKAARAAGVENDVNFFDITKKKPEDLPTFVNFIGDLPGLVSRLEGGLSVEGLKVSPARGAPPVTIAKAGFQSGAAGDGKTGNVLLTVSAEQIAIPAGMVPIEPKLLPHSFTVDLNLGALPTPALWDQARTQVLAAVTAKPAPGTPEQSAAERLGAALEATGAALLPAALQAAQTTPPRLEVKALTLANAESKVSGTGAFVYAPAAPVQATGQLDLRLQGLDTLITDISALPASSDQQNAVMVLTMLRGLSKPVPGNNGAIDHQLDLVLDPAGKVLINGMDLAPIIAGKK